MATQLGLTDVSLVGDRVEERAPLRALRWDELPVYDGELLRIRFEATAPRAEGVRLKCDGGLVVDGMEVPWIDLWVDASPTDAVVECRTCDGTLQVFDLWDPAADDGAGPITSCLCIDEAPAGARKYRCRGMGPSARTDSYVLFIERLAP